MPKAWGGSRRITDSLEQCSYSAAASASPGVWWEHQVLDPGSEIWDQESAFPIPSVMLMLLVWAHILRSAGSEGQIDVEMGSRAGGTWEGGGLDWYRVWILLIEMEAVSKMALVLCGDWPLEWKQGSGWGCLGQVNDMDGLNFWTVQRAILELYFGGRDVGLADGWDLGCEGRKGRRKGATYNWSNVSEDTGRHTRRRGGVGQLWYKRAAMQTHCRVRPPSKSG